jgi:phosphate/sulfate permease
MKRKFDPANGVICSLTGKIAAFEKDCPDFKLDETVKIEIDDKELLGHHEVKQKLPTEIFEKLRLEQNLLGAIVAGLVTAILCAILWGVFTVTFEFQISYMAILVGAGVGYLMRKVGKGVDQIFGFFGAGISLLGCLLGNFLSIIGFVAIANDLEYMETLTLFDYSQLTSIMAETFDIRDLIFYAVAIITGYKLGMRSITEKDIKTLKENARSH